MNEDTYNWNKGLVYEITVKRDGTLLANHKLKPHIPHLDRNLDDICWQIKQQIKQRGLEA